LAEVLPSLHLDLRTAIDIGCGVGYFAKFLADLGLAVVAVDGRPENVIEARSRYPHLRFVVQDIEDAALRELGTFDLVICVGVLYHLENPFAAVRNLHHLTRSVLLIESRVSPGEAPSATLVDEGLRQDQGLNYCAFIPTRACLAKMLSLAGFSHVYSLSRLPEHADFQDSVKAYRNRDMLVASKSELTSPLLKPILPSFVGNLWHRPLVATASRVLNRLLSLYRKPPACVG